MEISKDEESVDKAFERAVALASRVPESMQAAAFHRALDFVLFGSLRPLFISDRDPNNQIATPGQSREPRSQPLADVTTPRETASDRPSTLDRVLAAITPAHHPEVAREQTVRDRALAVLRAALRHAGVDGLTPPQIAVILTQTFRIPVSDAAVRMAFGDAGRLISREQGEDGAFVYRIMQPGEEYLDSAPRERERLLAAAKRGAVRKTGSGGTRGTGRAVDVDTSARSEQPTAHGDERQLARTDAGQSE